MKGISDNDEILSGKELLYFLIIYFVSYLESINVKYIHQLMKIICTLCWLV